MFARFTTIFLVMAVAVMGCARAPDETPEQVEQEDAQQPESIPVDLAGSAIESLKDDLLAPAATEDIPEGWEPGNLSEYGVAELLTESDWLRAIEASKSEPILIFKHSTECSISGGAYRRLGAYLKEGGEDTPRTYLVKVIERRPVSQKIESDIQIKHESPQALLLENGKIVWNTSHEDITEDSVRKAFEALTNSDEG